jgi:hypothetical protein
MVRSTPPWSTRTRVDDLPTPPVIALTGLDAAFTSKLTVALMAYEPKPALGMLYAGFASYQDMRMRRFFAELEKVPGLASKTATKPQASAYKISSR